MRLNKYIAKSGFCTRREAEALVKKGLVTVDGDVVTNPGQEVSGEETIIAQGTSISTYEKPEYYLINKEKNNYAVKTGDHFGLIGLLRGTTAQKLEVMHPMPYAHTGLHVITNDQEMIQRMTAPGARIKCTYQVALSAESRNRIPAIVEALADQNLPVVTIEDSYYHLSVAAGPESTPAIVQHIESADAKVLRVDRMTYAGMTKKDLKRGWSRRLTEQEVIMLKHFV